MIASASEDKSCKIWKHEMKNKEQQWTEKRLNFAQNVPLYQVSWS